MMKKRRGGVCYIWRLEYVWHNSCWRTTGKCGILESSMPFKKKHFSLLVNTTLCN